MLIVHHLANSRSQRILWMLEELGAEYQVVRYEREPSLFAPASLRSVHPLGKSPVIIDNGLVVAESGAIVDYLSEQFGGLRPLGTTERRRASYWVHFAEGSAMLPLMLKLYISRLGDDGAPLRPRVKQQLSEMLDYVEAELRDGPYLAGGEVSTADIMMSYPLEATAARSDVSGYPGILSYLGRIHARPAYAAALERGGPYKALR